MCESLTCQLISCAGALMSHVLQWIQLVESRRQLWTIAARKRKDKKEGEREEQKDKQKRICDHPSKLAKKGASPIKGSTYFCALI